MNGMILVVAHALHLTKQAVILLAKLHAALIAFVFQIIYNIIHPYFINL